MERLLLRVLAAVACVAIFGSLLYYCFPVTTTGLVGVLLISVACARLMPIPTKGKGEKRKVKSGKWSERMLAGIACVGLGAWWSAMLDVAITDAVRSPWGSVPPFAIVALGVTLFAVLVLAARGAQRLAMTLFAATFFSAIAMAAVVYPLGFGFDPFLHRATIAHIAEYGTITPKPLYYIGEYAIALVLSELGRIPLAALDRFLLPVLATGALLTSAWYGLRDIAGRRTALALTTLMLLPLSAFISTTPQGIAYVFALAAIFMCVPLLQEKSGRATLPILLAAAALVTHPFAGIPVVVFVSVVLGMRMLPERRAVQWGALAAAGVASLVAIPVVFALQAARSGLDLAVRVANLVNAEQWRSLALTGFFSNHYSTWYDGLYLVVDNLFMIVVFLGVVGTFALGRSPRLLLPLVCAVGMFCNFLLLSIVFEFDFLIAYERSDYAVRALTLTMLFLMPAAALAIARLDAYLATKPRALRITALTLLALSGMANVYGAYPRHDNYARSAGFNVSTADFDAVAAIASAGGDEHYIVLANQATSAAAVASYGFRTYYHTDIFYYPIPTGGPLYRQFLSMVNNAPSRETMTEAMDIAGVDLGFFAVSDYWWKSEQIIEHAKREADDWFAVDGGAVTVFVYQRE